MFMVSMDRRLGSPDNTVSSYLRSHVLKEHGGKLFHSTPKLRTAPKSRVCEAAWPGASLGVEVGLLFKPLHSLGC